MRISIVVTGEPVAKGRPRAAVIGGKARMYTPGKTRSWENDARQLARIEMGPRAPLDGPLKLSVLAVFPVPSSWPKWKRALVESAETVHFDIRPDIDNVCKSASDALDGIVWLDDKQIVEIIGRKVYGIRPRVEIEVERCRGWHSDSKRGDEG